MYLSLRLGRLTNRSFAVTWKRRDVSPEQTGAGLEAFASLYVREGEGFFRRVSSPFPPWQKMAFVACAWNDATLSTQREETGSEAYLLFYEASMGEGASTKRSRPYRNHNIATGWAGHGGSKDYTFGEYVLGLSVHPLDASRVTITDLLLDFVHVTKDRGATWQQAYSSPSTETKAGKRTPDFTWTASGGNSPHVGLVAQLA